MVVHGGALEGLDAVIVSSLDETQGILARHLAKEKALHTGDVTNEYLFDLVRAQPRWLLVRLVRHRDAYRGAQQTVHEANEAGRSFLPRWRPTVLVNVFLQAAYCPPAARAGVDLLHTTQVCDVVLSMRHELDTAPTSCLSVYEQSLHLRCVPDPAAELHLPCHFHEPLRRILAGGFLVPGRITIAKRTHLVQEFSSSVADGACSHGHNAANASPDEPAAA
mmetsp:Transcript_42963/g.118818  ORF Transcript_42963/g.118818 Transcript_42963/m.118818 type:complete len:221 (+) Transcript_42963:972-1634(+)